MRRRKLAVIKASTTVVTMFLLPGKETADADGPTADIDTVDGTDQPTGIEIMDNIDEPK
jgi:hypothetical protein